jgi:hypothetical protein
VIPGAHRQRRFAFEQTTPGSRTQLAVACLGLDFGDGFRTDLPGLAIERTACVRNRGPSVTIPARSFYAHAGLDAEELLGTAFRFAAVRVVVMGNGAPLVRFSP